MSFALPEYKTNKRYQQVSNQDDADTVELRLSGDDLEIDNLDPLLQEDPLLIERLRNEFELKFDTADTYKRQSRVVNRAMQDIGMGRYQWELFTLCGFGWFADNFWLQGLALSLPSLSREFGLSETDVRYTTMILYIGLGIGSVGWGVLSDVVGRRIAFNSTLIITGVFGVLIALGPTWGITATLFALMGVGVGGNLPIDGALFLEFIPAADNRLLTLLGAWWPLGQFSAALLAWYYIPKYSCPENTLPCAMTTEAICCLSKNNRGWRYLIATLGFATLFMYVCRVYFFKLFESPKFLLSQGKTSEAIQIVRQVAHYNGTNTWLDDSTMRKLAGHEESDLRPLRLADAAKRDLSKFSLNKLKALFSSWRLGFTTILLGVINLTVGMAFPLFNAFILQYLGHAGSDPVPTDVIYTNYLIASLMGLPGNFIASYAVDLPGLGRKGTMALFTVLTGVSLFLFVLSDNPVWQTFAAGIQSLASNAMYGVIYSYTPEVFPGPVRGTGSGLANLLNRASGIVAPILAVHLGKQNPTSPIISAAALYMAASVAMCLLPIETRGQQSL